MSSEASQSRATFIYKGNVLGIPLREIDNEGSNVLPLLRKSLKIPSSKLVYIEDSKGQVHETRPIAGERYFVKVEPEEMSTFKLWETFQCCSGVPVGWENADT